MIDNAYAYLTEGNTVWYLNSKCKGIISEDKPYLLGIITKVNQDNKTISIKDSNDKIKYEDTLPYTYNEKINTSELLNLDDASEIDILNNISNRLLISHNTFTNLGPLLLIINPYEANDNDYSIQSLDKIIELHSNDAINSISKSSEPHLYEVVVKAIKLLLLKKENQIIVFEGESGAGKTEATDHSLQSILYYFSKNNESESVSLLQNQIANCNIILEAFANAKTTHNNNSSRFSKSLSLIINTNQNSIEGLQISTFLLEKSRVSDIPEGERCFNIFYQLLLCGNLQLLASLYLTSDITLYELLNKSNCAKIEGINDKEGFKDTMRCLEENGFTKEEVDTIYKMLSSVLLLGNLTFVQESSKDIVISNKDTLEHISELLQSKDEDIEKAFTVNINKISGVEYSKPVKDVAEAKLLCNAFAQELYNKLFHFIVMKLNLALAPKISSNPNNKVITLIDIFGFENNKTNSLEHLCINYSNELLQHYYMKSYYTNEIIDYKQDGLNEYADMIKCPTNQDVINMFDSDNKSLFPLIKESTFNSQTNIKFFDNLQKVIGKSNKLLQFPRNVVKGSFQFNHPAMSVVYNSTQMLQKNKDEVKNTLIEIIERSRNVTMKQIYLNNIIPKEQLQSEFDEIKKIDYQKKNKGYIIDKFNKELKTLINSITDNETHYIICLKPNVIQKGIYIQESYLLNQIRYFGIAQAIRFKTEGYPIKWLYYNFLKHFDLIFPDLEQISTTRNKDYRASSIKILEILAPECLVDNNNDTPLFLCGTKRLFLKKQLMSLLQSRMEDKLKTKIEGLNIIKVGIIHIKKKKKIKTYKTNIKNIQIFYKTNISRTKIQKKITNIGLIQSAVLAKQIKNDYNILMAKYQTVQLFLKSRMAFSQMEQKRKALRLLGFRIHIYMKYMIQKRRKKMMNIAKYLIYRSIDVITVGEYYNVWRKIQPFFKSCLIRKKYGNIAYKAKLGRYRDKKALMFQMFSENNFLMKIRVKANSSKVIRSFILSNISFNYFESLRNSIAIIQEYARRYYLKREALQQQLKKCFNDDEEDNDKTIQFLETTLFPYVAYFQRQQIKQQQQISLLQQQTQHQTQSQTQPPIIQQQSLTSLSNQGSQMYYSPSSSFYDNKMSINQNNRKDLIEKELSNKEFNSNVILPEIESYNEEKIKLFAKVLDIDIMTDISEIYDNSWAEEFNKINRLNMEKKTPIQIIYASDNHTIVLNSTGKIYSWGWNNYGQSGNNTIETTKNGILPSFTLNASHKFPLLPLVNYKASILPVFDSNLSKEIGKISHIACGNDYTLILNEKGRVFGMGQNDKGQLGLGNTKLSNQPQILCSNNLDGRIKDMKIAENMTIILTNEGEIYMWNTLKEKEHCLPFQIYMNPKIKISQLSCGCNFIILLTQNGIVFGMGNNTRGELGLNEPETREDPEEIIALSEYRDKIISVKCGFKHTLCLSSTGKVYSWGVNSSGQLGIGKQFSSSLPQVIQLPFKAVQIAAGFRNSMFLMENKSMFFCGIISSSQIIVYKPIQFIIQLKSPEVSNENEFCPIRIATSWNKSFSVFYATYADLRQLSNKVSPLKINHIFKTLTTKWINERVSCPYIESIAPYFNAYFMKK